MSPASRDEEAIQLDRHGALRAPCDDNHFEDTPSLKISRRGDIPVALRSQTATGMSPLLSYGLYPCSIQGVKYRLVSSMFATISSSFSFLFIFLFRQRLAV